MAIDRTQIPIPRERFMVRKPRDGKTGSRRDRKTISRKPQDQKTGSRKPPDRKTSSEKLEVLRTDLQALRNRIDQVERHLDETDHATKGAILRLTQAVGELNVRLTSVAANVFEVIAMAGKASEAVNGSEQKLRSRSKLDGEIIIEARPAVVGRP
jgi:hypothetical protein